MRRKWGRASTEGLYPRQFGVHPGGAGQQFDHPCLSSYGSERVLLYLYAVRLVLRAPFWPYSAVRCELLHGLSLTGEMRLQAPCRQLRCPDCLTGHIDRTDLPVLYHSRLPDDPSLTCGLTIGAEPTLEEIGQRLGVRRQRICQIIQRAVGDARGTRIVRLSVHDAAGR